MNEVTEQQNVMHSPLESVHQQLEADLSEYSGWLMPARYGTAATEYAAVREGGAGLIDLSPRGRIRVGGTEAVMFLNGLITNDMKTLDVGQWMMAAFPSVQGRLIAAVRIARLQDEETEKGTSPVFLIDTEAATREKVLTTVSRFTLAGDFRVTDITTQTAMISLQGKSSQKIMQDALHSSAANELKTNGAAEFEWNGTNITVLCASHTAEDGYDFIVNTDQSIELWKALSQAGAKPVGYETLNVLRIESGIGQFGVDMDETNVVTEANLDDAVSFTKGCYIGQEIIARIKYRGHVAKKLVGLVLDSTHSVAVKSQIKVGDKEVGRITSSVASPKLNKTIALGYVRYEHMGAGTNVIVVTESGDEQATVTALPMVTGVEN